MNAEVEDSWGGGVVGSVVSVGGVPAEASEVGMARTVTICAIDGSTPAMACPVMIAWIYAGWPKPAENANVPFWISDVPKLEASTIANVKPR